MEDVVWNHLRLRIQISWRDSHHPFRRPLQRNDSLFYRHQNNELKEFVFFDFVTDFPTFYKHTIIQRSSDLESSSLWLDHSFVLVFTNYCINDWLLPSFSTRYTTRSRINASATSWARVSTDLSLSKAKCFTRYHTYFIHDCSLWLRTLHLSISAHSWIIKRNSSNHADAFIDLFQYFLFIAKTMIGWRWRGVMKTRRLH